jgi:cell division protein FtsL
MSETKEPKIARKGVLITLGIICIILVACLLGVVTAYTVMINDKSNTISSLNYQISQLNSTVTNLQKQVANLQSRLVMADTVEGLNEQLGLQLTMTLEKTNYSLFEPINIYFTITNISNQTINLDSYGLTGFDMFEFQVFNDTNNIIYSLIFPVYAGYYEGAISVTSLNPEESLTGVLEWEQMFNNTVPNTVSPGTYYIVGQIGPIFLNGLTIETTPIQIVIA